MRKVFPIKYLKQIRGYSFPCSSRQVLLALEYGLRRYRRTEPSCTKLEGRTADTTSEIVFLFAFHLSTIPLAVVNPLSGIPRETVHVGCPARCLEVCYADGKLMNKNGIDPSKTTANQVQADH